MMPHEVISPVAAGMNISGMVSTKKYAVSLTAASGISPLANPTSISTKP